MPSDAKARGASLDPKVEGSNPSRPISSRLEERASPPPEATVPLPRAVPPAEAERPGALRRALAVDATRDARPVDATPVGRDATAGATGLSSPGARRIRACVSGSIGPSSRPKISDPATRSTIAGRGTFRLLAANSGMGTTSTNATNASSRVDSANAAPEPDRLLRESPHLIYLRRMAPAP
jgi:hypothetical protein